MFKNWPYWIRGGALFGCISFIAGLSFHLPTNPLFKLFKSTGLFADIVSMVVFIFSPANLLAEFGLGMRGPGSRPSPQEVMSAFVWGTLISVIVWFILGAFIGWLYGKIKSRRTINSTLNA